MNKRFLAAALFVGLFCAAIGIYISNRQTSPQPAKNGAVQQLTALSLTDSQGKLQKISQWQGKFLVVNFWATWCAPCVQEMPELSELQKDLSKSNVQLIGLGIDSPSNIVEFAQKYQISYPLFAAGMEGTELSRQLGNQAAGLPFTVLISPDGNLLKSYLGRLNIEQLRSDIIKLTNSKQ
jgi:thiol-disulfide isomerase/thioredoxin